TPTFKWLNGHFIDIKGEFLKVIERYFYKNFCEN
ncbi:MAG: hypothetical protein ACI82Z_000570, partial [Cellvibrionaceae bacterium]